MLEGFEYTFFNQSIADKFISFLNQKNITGNLDEEEDFMTGDSTYIVRIQTSLDDALAADIEVYYDDLLFGEQASLIDGNNEDGALADICGVQVKLSNGEFTTIAVHPEIMNKLLSVLSIDEIQAFMAQVAEDIENPKSGPICRRK